MDENKEKMIPVQLVVVIFTVICFFVLILLGTLMLGGIFDEEKAEIWNGVFWIIITFAQLLLACGNWKKQKVTSTV